VLCRRLIRGGSERPRIAENGDLNHGEDWAGVRGGEAAMAVINVPIELLQWRRKLRDYLY